MRNTDDRYGTMARALHWGIGLLLLGQIAGGFYAFEVLEGRTPERMQLIGMHKSMGLTLLVLIVLRVAWRLHDRPPALPATMSALERRLAPAGHLVLYGLMLMMPIAGLLHGQFSERATSFWGLFTIPALLAKSELGHEIAEKAHVWGAWALLAVVVVHAALAIHHKLRKDGVAERMM